MFYLNYLKAELTRRFSKTLTISLGLALASGIIILLISATQSLSKAQNTVLNPLQNVGTDALITRSIENTQGGMLDEKTRTDLMSENRISTDLSKLGKAGDAFVNDTFAPGSLLTFEASESAKLDPTLVKESAQGLILNVIHQQGTIPTITAQFQTGGERIQFQQDISPLTDADQTAIDAARTKAMEDMKTQGIDPRSEAGRQIMRDAMNAAMPDRLKQVTGEIITPEKMYTQQLDTPQTDINTSNFTVAGVDTSKIEIGLILPTQITDGTYFTGADQVIVNQSYADKNAIKVGDTFTLGGKTLAVVGIVEPKLYTNTADLYLPLADLQTLSGRTDRINILLIKSTDAASVAETSQKLAGLFSGAKIVNSADTAQKVTGSLNSAANLTSKFSGIAAAVVIFFSFLVVILLTLLSLNKRIREIGTLKALGWNNGIIVRQIFMENVVLGIFGGITGVGFGLLGIYLLNRYNISLSATIESMDVVPQLIGRFTGGRGGFGTTTSNSAAAGVTTSVALHITYSYITLLIGAGVAFFGSILAGCIGAIKSSRMRPQEALRNLE